MGAPDLSYTRYSQEWCGQLAEDAFLAALRPARARLTALTGDSVPAVWEDRWLDALCALVDRIGGADGQGLLASETVGSTTYVYSQRAQDAAPATDYELVVPYLARTGLLCTVMGARP